VELDRMPPGTALLDERERARHRRLASPRQARRYASTRSALRVVLGAALDLAPQDVALEQGPHGKPLLAGATGISFNLSHRGDSAVIALAAGCEVGVDVELSSRLAAPTRLAGRFFDAGEAATIAALPEALARDAFLRCWTAKEAVLKAIGTGLEGGMREVVVSADPREPLRLLGVPGPLGAADWTLHELCLPRHGLRLALALAAPGARIAAVSGLPGA
jgi:4'-phosphopantetheinyl transferase